MGAMSSKETGSEAVELFLCTCYVCGGDALWEIGVSGEDEGIEGEFACEVHARGHLRLAIVLPERTSERSPYVSSRTA
jgi:hypothetical protein